MKRITTILMLLMLICMGAWATTYTITYSTTTGTFRDGNNNAVTTGWIAKWISNEAGKPVVTLTASANNINADNGRMAPGSSGSCTYALSVQDGYIITGFSLNCPTFGAEVTVTPGGESATVVSTGGTLVVNSTSNSFVYSGDNAGRIQASASDGGSFTITVEEDADWTPNIDANTYVNVGSKATSITAATDKNDNDHWYILTQARGGESPMYNVGTGNQLKRTATTITPSTINGTAVTGNYQYLIRFIETPTTGLYNIQFADGNFITSSLTTSNNKSAAGRYAFYKVTGGTYGSDDKFGWNLNGNYGSKVDNNGPGENIAFWGSGLNDGSAANNVWTIYPVELTVPSAFVQYVISDASGVVYTSDEVSASLNDVITTLPAAYQRDYCSYEVTEKTVTTSGVTTVPVTVSYDLPFTVSSDFAGATWYYATLRGKYLRADDSAKDGSGRYATNATNEYTDAYKWAFFGNPYDNFYVMNKAQGSSKYMYKGDSQITFDSPAEPTADNKALWAVTPNTNGGFTLRNIDGGANWYVNDVSNDGNLGFWNDGRGANDGGSNWVVTEVPAIEVDVTYELWEGGAKVNTVVERVAANSAVAVPASLTTNYSTFAYNFATSGTIGEENCTITVTATLKSGVTPVGSLSNSKKYRLTTPTRGSLSTYTTGDNTYLASPVKSGLSISAKEFAILNYDGKYYLYSVSDGKFVTYQSATVAPLDDMVTGTSDAIAFSQISNSVYQIRFDNDINKIVNCSDSDPFPYGFVLNDWGRVSSEWDDGNQFIIEEVGDFDATTPLTALGNFFNSLAYDNSIAELKAINWGLTSEGNKGKLNYYNFIGDYVLYAGNEMSTIETLEGAGYSAENLAITQDIIANGYALNMPTTGKFYRIKGYSNNYITSNTASNNAAMNGTASANNIVYYSAEQNFIFYGSGLGMYNTSIVAPVANTLNAYTFSEGAQKSHYYIRSNAASVGTYCFDNTANGTKVDRNTSPVTSGNYQTDWTLEEVTSLPVTISSVGYATLYAPVALTIPSSDGVKAYTGEISGDVFRLSEVDGTIPANTGVVLIGDAGTYNFNITSSAAFDGSNDLLGTVRTIAKPGDVLVLGMNDVVGFYTFTGANLSGFKTYLPEPTSGARALKIIFDDSETTGVNEVIGNMSEVTDGAIYDLQGRKVANPSRGMYIINGRKIVIK